MLVLIVLLILATAALVGAAWYALQAVATRTSDQILATLAAVRRDSETQAIALNLARTALAQQLAAVASAIPPAPPIDTRPDAIQREMQALTAQMSALRLRVDQGLLATPPRAFASEEIQQLLLEVCANVGLDPSKIDAGFNLAATGKLHDVLDGLAKRVGQAHPIATAGDVAALFERVGRELVAP